MPSRRVPEHRAPDSEQLLYVALSQFYLQVRQGAAVIKLRLPEQWDRAVALVDRNSRVYTERVLTDNSNSLYNQG